MERMTRERAEAERELIDWGLTHARRDQIIVRAYQVGVPKRRIHALTGVARSTIDIILQGGERNG